MSSLKRFAPLVVWFIFFCLSVAQASAESALSDAQSQAVEKIVHDYLLSHPDVLIESMSNAEAKEKAKHDAGSKQNLVASKAQLYDDIQSPIIGNPKGNTTIVEFFDYRCPYCKVMAPTVFALVDKNPQLRVIMKEFPILSPESETASRVALVAAAHGKYPDFHRAMFAFKGTFNNEAIFGVAKDIGLNVSRLPAEMQSEAVTMEIQRNQLLARAIGIDGTPSFIAGDQIIPGATDAAGLQALVTKAAGNTPAKS